MKTDCRTEEGITVGLIDSLISIARVLSKRNLSSSEIKEALQDLREDEDVNVIFDPPPKKLPFVATGLLQRRCPHCGKEGTLKGVSAIPTDFPIMVCKVCNKHCQLPERMTQL